MSLRRLSHHHPLEIKTSICIKKLSPQHFHFFRPVPLTKTSLLMSFFRQQLNLHAEILFLVKPDDRSSKKFLITLEGNHKIHLKISDDDKKLQEPFLIFSSIRQHFNVIIMMKKEKAFRISFLGRKIIFEEIILTWKQGQEGLAACDTFYDFFSFSVFTYTHHVDIFSIMTFFKAFL